MNRKIAFRAWDKSRERMITEIKKLQWWPTGLYVNSGMGSVEGNVPDENTVGAGYMRMVLMQFTGLLDKNGKEIYEGDLLSYFGGSQVVAVEWNKDLGAWCAMLQTAGGETRPGLEIIGNHPTSEVIGNIHENPELLQHD